MIRKLIISEIYGPVIQGEGALMGLPTVFVRLAGCDYRCHWCDSLHAVLPENRSDWLALEVPAILHRIADLSGRRPMLVTLSGGNPALQPLGELIRAGVRQGYEFALETQGSRSNQWFSDLQHLVLSPKPPSAGRSTSRKSVHSCIHDAGAQTSVSLKIVVGNESDYHYARVMAAYFPSVPCYLQPANLHPELPDETALTQRYKWLVDRVISDQWYSVRILPQLHIIMWGHGRGV